MKRVWPFTALIILMSFMTTISTSTAETLVARCISPSGLSTYDLDLDTETQKGEIRYRFQRQDVFYDVTLNSESTELIVGVAVFKSSLSGEIKGNPFAFTYDPGSRLFKELNLTMTCQPMTSK